MDMPKTRASLFFLVLKDHLFDFVKVNMMQMLFWIPCFIWCFLNLLAPQAENAQEASALLDSMSGYLFTWLVGLIPCIAITGPSTAAAAYIMRNWSKDQHAFLWSDFKDAFLGNWKQALSVSILTGFLPVVLYASLLLYGQMARTQRIMLLPLVVTIIVGILFALMLVLLYPLMTGYVLRYPDLFKNAFLIAAAELPKMLLARVITAIPLLILLAALFIGNGMIVLLVALYYMLYGLAFERFVYASFANAAFDRYLNPRIEGATVRAGLRPEAEADEEDEMDEEEEGEGEETENALFEDEA